VPSTVRIARSRARARLPAGVLLRPAQHFRVNAKDAQSGNGKGRVVERLEIGLINALTPQAKGRVERANKTLQDRLIKEMRLRNICSIPAAQAYLAEFILEWNKKFAVPPGDETPRRR
jgi:hypothetical protein